MSENSNSKRPFELEWEWTELLKQRLPLKCRSTPHLHEISPNTYNSYFSISSLWNEWPETDDVFFQTFLELFLPSRMTFENMGAFTKHCSCYSGHSLLQENIHKLRVWHSKKIYSPLDRTSWDKHMLDGFKVVRFYDMSDRVWLRGKEICTNSTLYDGCIVHVMWSWILSPVLQFCNKNIIDSNQVFMNKIWMFVTLVYILGLTSIALTNNP